MTSKIQLGPDWREVRQELMAAPPASPLDLAGINELGVYAWWDLRGSLAPFWPTVFPAVDPQQPLYVGIAERDVLSNRAGKMHLRTTRMSTIRRSLAALLVDELDLLSGIVVDPKRRTKFKLAPNAELRLTEWMVASLKVTWVLHPTPIDVETDIIADLTPPLNYDHATKGPYPKPLQEHRSQFLLRVSSI